MQRQNLAWLNSNHKARGLYSCGAVVIRFAYGLAGEMHWCLLDLHCRAFHRADRRSNSETACIDKEDFCLALRSNGSASWPCLVS